MNKYNTGIAAEFAVATEFARRNFNVAMTFGNTKKNDLLVEKNGITRSIQVKGIKQRKNNNFRLKLDSLEETVWYVLVNVNRVSLKNLEFAILNYSEVIENLRRPVTENDNALPVSILDNKNFSSNWERIIV